METDNISMSLGYELVPVHGMRDISTHLHSVSKPPVCHGAWVEIDYISMSPGHELIPVHGIRDMSLGHIDTFAFCINTSRLSWRLNGDWLHFHVPGTWINSCSWHAWYVPGTYRHIYILYQNPRMSWRLDGDWLYFHVPGTWMSCCSWHAWYVPGTYRHICILYQIPPYVMAPGRRLILFPCPRDMN